MRQSLRARADRHRSPTPFGARSIQTVRDLVLLVARVGLGVMMLAHAKLEYDYGGSLAGVVKAFEQSGVPLPAITGPTNLFGELIGGIAMILGLAVPVVGALMALNMVGAVSGSGRARPPDLRACPPEG
ncbi:MAG: DoxX family protein [Pseudonocardiaceae bacterium]